MEPLISEGDRLEFEVCEPGTLKLGDVVLFNDGAQWLAHRIVAQRENEPSLYQRGDAEGCGYWISADQVAGRLLSVNDVTEPEAYVACVVQAGPGRQAGWGRLCSGAIRTFRVWRLRRVLKRRA